MCLQNVYLHNLFGLRLIVGRQTHIPAGPAPCEALKSIIKLSEDGLEVGQLLNSAEDSRMEDCWDPENHLPFFFELQAIFKLTLDSFQISQNSRAKAFACDMPAPWQARGNVPARVLFSTLALSMPRTLPE